jgi:hypothetical protein
LTSLASSLAPHRDSFGTRCANPRCHKGGTPEPVYGRQVICDYCTRRVERHLVELAGVFDDLGTVLAVGGNAAFDKVSGSRTPPVPVRLEVADHREEIRSILVSWARLVVEERRLSQWPSNTVHDIAQFVSEHADWLACHPAAGDLCEEIARALGRAHGLLTGPGVVCFLPCPDIFGEGCDGRIKVTPEATWVRCETCGWETDDLLWLGKLVRGDEPALVTAAQACHRFLGQGRQLSSATIRQWVKRGKVAVRGRDEAGRSLYDLDELAAQLPDPGDSTG